MYTAQNEQAIWPAAIAEHHPAAHEDVRGVAGRDALVDDVPVDARQVQRRDRAAELEQHDQPELGVKRGQIGTEQAPEHQVSFRSLLRSQVSSSRARMPSSSSVTISCGVIGDVGEPRVRARKRDRAQEPRRFLGRAADLVAVGREQLRERGAQPRVVDLRRWWPARPGRRREAEHREQLPDLADATLQHLDRGDELVAQRQLGIDPRDLGLVRGRIEHAGDRRGDQRLLVGKHAEQGPLRDAGGERDLRRRDLAPVHAQERQRRRDDARAPRIGRQRSRANHAVLI